METWNDSQRTDVFTLNEDPVSANMNNSSDVPSLNTNDEVVDMGADFDFEGFQVVRREFFAHLREPAVTFNNYKFYVNCACLNKFPDAFYVQVLVNQETKIMALRPCAENTRDSFAWCGMSKGKRSPRQITCKLFFAKMFSMMAWNPDYRYKLLGRLIHANGEYMIAFDLTATEVYQRSIPEGEKPRTSRTPVFPSGWQNQFGLPYKEHQHAMQVNIFDGYAVYSIKEASKKAYKELCEDYMKTKQYYIEQCKKRWKKCFDKASSNRSKNPGFDTSILFDKTANAEEVVGYYLTFSTKNPLDDWLNDIEGLDLSERDKEVTKILKELEE